MRGLPPESVDLIFADPPFNVGKKYGNGHDDQDSAANYYAWCEQWIAECFRLLAATGTIYLMTITRHLARLYPMLASRGVFVNQINWRNVAAAHSKRGFWNSYQPILVYARTQDYIFNHYAQARSVDPASAKHSWESKRDPDHHRLLDEWPDIPNVYAGSSVHPEGILKPGTNSKLHPAQLPVALPERAILFSTNPGGLVLDPFAGVGACGLAALKHDRRYMGAEQNAEFAGVARQRLEWAISQPSLI